MVRFVVDENLPPRLVQLLRDRGHEADDFRLLQVATGRPRKLLLVSTGNISNRDLIALLRERGDDVEAALDAASCVELGRASITVYLEGDG